jgi:integrase
LPQKTRQLLANYIYTLKNKSPEALLFPSQKRNPDGSQRPLNTASLDYIYQTYTSQLFSSEDEQTHITSYAARKTYGHNIYTECMKKHNGFLPGTDINALQYVQSVFNHESSNVTLRYIGAYDTPANELAESIQDKYDF